MSEAPESDDSRIPVSESFELRYLKVQLRFLRTLCMCGKNWGKAAESILFSVSQTLESHELRFLSTDLTLTDSIQQSFREEMEKVCKIFSDKSLQTSSSDPVVVEVLLEIMGSLLLYFRDFLQYEDISEVEKLEKNVNFLKNFILFVRDRGIQHSQMEDLLIHIESLVLDSSRFTFMLWYELCFTHSDCRYEMWININQLVDRIKPVEPDVSRIYVGILQQASSRESSESPPESSQIAWLVLRNFIDSLLILLEDLLIVHQRDVENYDHRLQELRKKLSFLRTIMRMDVSPEILDRIGVEICQGGKLIFSLCVKKEDEGVLAEELESLFSDFEQTYQSILAQPYVLGFIDSVLEKLESVRTREANSGAQGRDKLDNLHKDFTFLRSLLVNLMVQCGHNEKLRNLKNDVIAVAQETKNILDSPNSESLFTQLDAIREKINQIQESENPASNEIAVGLDDETQCIINELTKGVKTRDIVSIVGMPGLGKSTLAKKVFDDPAITAHFDVRSWAHVSQNYKKKNMLLEILDRAGYKSLDNHFRETEDDLADKLRKHLKQQRYLIILDDVWDTFEWDSLKLSFPEDRNGSRVLLTSRHHYVPLKINPNRKPYPLRWLNNEECWILLQKKMGVKAGSTPTLVEIAENCKGSPLMVTIVAGILSNGDATTWEEVAEKLKEGTLSISKHCRQILELSYSHLSDDLKRCFLYFGAFQEYARIPVRNLLWLWIAEELVEEKEGFCLEDVAEEYLEGLIDRSLVMVSEKGSRGRAKSCVLHDLLLDFCKIKINERFFYCLQKKHELSKSVDPSTLSALRVYSRRVEDFKDSTLYAHLCNLYFVADYEKGLQQLRGILVEICQSKSLRVLDLRQINKVLFFPTVFKLYEFLKYLAFRPFTISIEGEFLTIPSSIDNLSNLETFIVEGSGLRLSLPGSMWNMKRLKHLCISGSACLELPKGSMEGHSSIETLSTVVFPCSHTMEQVIRRFPNIRRLKCKFFKAKASTGGSKILTLNFLSQLESLTVYQIPKEFHDVHFEFPRNLKKLVLSNFCLPWSKISTLVKLPNLEVLKLLDDVFKGETWKNVKDETFPELRFLKLANLDLAKWTDWDEGFPRLENLVLERCCSLEELPSFNGSIYTLEMIEASDCKSATEAIKGIMGHHHEYGNQYLKVIIDNMHYSST